MQRGRVPAGLHWKGGLVRQVQLGYAARKRDQRNSLLLKVFSLDQLRPEEPVGLVTSLILLRPTESESLGIWMDTADGELQVKILRGEERY